MQSATAGQTPINFSAWTGRGVKVAVIDSGIDPKHPRIGRVQGGVEFAVNNRGKVIRGVGMALIDRTGHGTACAGIIRRIAPAAELYSVRVFDESLYAEGQALLEGLRWAIEHRMDVVNLSLGTTDRSIEAAMQDLCREAVQQRLILVAAAHNDGEDSLPAILSEVIAVRGGSLQGPHSYYYDGDASVECTARGDAQRVCWADKKEIMQQGNSFAAPHISGIVALLRQVLPDAPLTAVRAALAANALQLEAPVTADGGMHKPRGTARSPKGSNNRTGQVDTSGGHNRAVRRPGDGRSLDCIGRAVLYPFNKEMHALVRFRDMVPFALTGIADPIGKGLVGKDAAEVIGEPSMGLQISAGIEVAAHNADTLIIGYVDQLARIAKKDVLRDCIEKALDLGMHVFSYGPVRPEYYGDLYQRAADLGLQLFYSQVDERQVLAILKKGPMGIPVGAPVLTVFGTSASQGKFTLQLGLRRRLQALGYRVGQLGTEPHAELFGMDGCFPMGYASPLRIPLQHYPAYLDAQMRVISARRPDIIITGSQSGTIPYDIHSPDTYSLASLAFLLGIRADACVLVVNSIDADDYIQHTLDALRAVGKARVLALAMSDKEKNRREVMGRMLNASRQMKVGQIETRLAQLERRFSLPAVSILSEDGQQRLVELIVDYFGGEEKEELAWTKQSA